MSVAFIVIICLLIVLYYQKTKSLYNLYLLLAAPYVLIILVNQYIAAPYFAFYPISDDTITMIFFSLVVFFIGSYPLAKPNQGEQQNSINQKFDKYYMKQMSVFVFVCGMICMIWALRIWIFNPNSIELFEKTGSELSSGPIAHLKIIASSLAPITFTYGIIRKDRIAIVGTIMLFIAVFLTFTKYNIICAVIAVLIYIGLYIPELARKTLLSFVGFPIVLFVGNYYLSFYLRGVSSLITNTYYLNHLWTYIGGSVIYDNYIFTLGVRIGMHTPEKIMTFLFALPNLFLNKLFGIQIFPHIQQKFLSTSNGGEFSNVTDAFGYLYPSYGDIYDIVIYYVIIFMVSIVFTLAVNRMMLNTNTRLNATLPYFLSEFVLMSFFGTFYISPGPWEQLIFCAIMPCLFLRRTNISIAHG